MTRDDARLWTDRSCLQDVQYGTDANLAARQSIYAWQHPRLDLSVGMLRAARSPQPAAAHRKRAWPPGTPLPCRCAMTPAA
jgi:hypothetical protein